MQTKDLSPIHQLISKLFQWPESAVAWDQYRLSEAQIDSYNKNGFLAGVKILEEEQVHILRKALDELVEGQHPGNDLFYEFHSNESTDAETVLFHALGAWRISPGFHDVL